ncbi:MAG TPA: PAS domain S-box protein [Clostridia bacterium]|nr:PAS domain S-box protein [Clostridia bacterium]
MNTVPSLAEEDIDSSVQSKWQRLLDLSIEVIGVPFALITHSNASESEILLHSGDTDFEWNLGGKLSHNLEMLVKAVGESKEELAVEDASHTDRLAKTKGNAPGFAAFSGCPILWPSGQIFGTICVLDTQPRLFSELNRKILGEFAGIIQSDLASLLLQKDYAGMQVNLTHIESDLKDERGRFDQIFQTSTSGILITSMKDGIILDANYTYQRLFGYSRDELVGKSAAELNIYVNASDRNHVIAKLRKGEQVRDYEMPLRAKNGESRVVLGTVQPIILGGTNCLITSIYDITSLRHIEHESKLLNERYMLATRAAQAGIWDWDIVNNVLVWDQRMYQIYDATKEAFGGAYEAWLARILPEDMEKADLDSRLALLGEKEYDTEFRIHTSDGSIRNIKAYGDVIRDAAGSPLRMVGANFDITDRKILEQDVQESEKKYRDLFHENSAIRIVIDVDTGNLFDVNPAACSFYGYTREQLLSMNVTAINSMPIDLVLSILDMAYQKKRNYFQATHIRSNGEMRDVEIFNGPININQRRYLNCIVHDITERKEMEEKLIASEARYREIFHNNAAVQLVVDAHDSSIVDANRAACEYYGYSLKEITTKTVFDINPNSKEEIRRIFQESAKRGSNHFVTQHFRADHSIRDVEIFNGKIIIDGRDLLHVIIYDITESTRALMNLEKSEQRFRQLIENSPDGIVVETDGQFAYVNQKALELFRAQDIQDLIGTSFVDSFKQDGRTHIQALLAELDEGKKARILCEETIQRLDGMQVDIELSAVPFRFNERNGSLIYLRDMTERKEFEKAKEDMELQLRQKQKLESIGTLAGGVAHEINNPINGIINYAELIENGNITTEQVKTFSQGIIHEGKRIAEIVKNLLSFARQEKQTHSPARIEDIIDQSVSLMRVMLRHDQITLELDIPEDLPSIKCRSQQIQQVIMNLLTNARDALNAKYPGYHADKIIRIDCMMFHRDGRRWFQITVKDNGTGIPAEIMERIFDPFFTTKPRDEGTGLGLSISHGIVKDHHGELYFETEPGEYTKAILVLPVDNGWSV